MEEEEEDEEEQEEEDSDGRPDDSSCRFSTKSSSVDSWENLSVYSQRPGCETNTSSTFRTSPGSHGTPAGLWGKCIWGLPQDRRLTQTEWISAELLHSNKDSMISNNKIRIHGSELT